MLVKLLGFGIHLWFVMLRTIEKSYQIYAKFDFFILGRL